MGPRPRGPQCAPASRRPELGGSATTDAGVVEDAMTAVAEMQRDCDINNDVLRPFLAETGCRCSIGLRSARQARIQCMYVLN